MKGDVALGRQLGVKSTPTFFINGVKIEGALPPQYFDQAIAYELQHASREVTCAALATHELTKDYAVGFWRKRPYRALDRLTLEVEAGEVFGFLGPNGAGKTTTLKLLMQLVFPTSGRAEILGRPLGDLVGQAPHRLPAGESVLLRLPHRRGAAGLLRARSSASRRASARARASRLLDEVGIGAERRLQLRKFSKGMLQRVGIAQALINDPELVIFDEPMSGLDPLGRRDVRALILRLRDRGCTVFFSSHVLSDAEALCSRVAILAKGRLVAARPADRDARVPARSGWELVVAGVERGARSPRSAARVRRVVRIGEGRYTLELPLEPPPERCSRELTAAGAHLVSLNPIRADARGLLRPAGHRARRRWPRDRGLEDAPTGAAS